MEAPPVAVVPSNADIDLLVSSPLVQQESVALVADAAPVEESAIMKNTWLNASESPITPALAMDSLSESAADQGTGSPTLSTIARPLQLLDLPVDILKEVIKEVTHTNDLTSLALCHSALHRLVIPHIYSRFDIVWPDSVTPAEPRTGVDALTYGLATLVMAEDVFGEGAHFRDKGKEIGTAMDLAKDKTQGQTGSLPASALAASKHSLDTRVRRRRGNYYPYFTRKFSLGNGPPEWVQEYLISKEGGKMLGTLVALAVARMRNLETFVWDMPTGILRDVWIALSSLDDRKDAHPCRLERVAVRFHDNSPEPHALPLHHPQLPGSPHPLIDHVEHPSFSVLPPLKSLSVLDVDELQYLDEMSVLIGRSRAKLRELRVGIACHMEREWTTVWDGDQLQQVDKDHPTAGSVTIGEKRLGGILGVLTAWVSDMRRTYSLPHRPKRLRRRSNATVAVSNSPDHVSPEVEPSSEPAVAALSQDVSTIENLVELSIEKSPDAEAEPTIEGATPPASASEDTPTPVLEPHTHSTHSSSHPDEEDPRLAGKLSLETLELERVPLSIPVLQNVIDWGILTSLTLLQCPSHEHLWKTLRRLYSPLASATHHYSTSDPSRSKQKAPRAPVPSTEYKLKLTKIHTDTVTSSLITFIRETLAPNSLEVVFLQEAYPSATSVVSVESIYRGVLRKHRNSLKKVLIDSSERGVGGQPLANSRSKRWMFTHEIVEFVTSGKMPALRELGAAIDYRDWHYFLQRLPTIPHLRSLYLPYMNNYVHGSFISEPRDLALQIVDIVALRPEVELCYIGIAKKCFEILENVRGKDGTGSAADSAMVGPDDGEDDDADEDDDVDGDDDDHSIQSSSDSTEEADSDSDDDFERRRDVQLSLREILYYDDKVTIFKARHGRL